MMKNDIAEKIKETIKEGEIEEGEVLAKSVIKMGIDPLEALNVVIETLKEIGDAFGRREIFLVHLIMSSEVAQGIINVLTSELKRLGKDTEYLGRVIIGTVAGDIHDIGKRLVATFLQIEGFEVIDLGIDVPTDIFVEKVRELKPDILGLSALTTTTMMVQGEVIEALKKAGLREPVKVIIGGAPITPSHAEEMNADAYAADAIEATEKVKTMVK